MLVLKAGLDWFMKQIPQRIVGLTGRIWVSVMILFPLVPALLVGCLLVDYLMTASMMTTWLLAT